MPEMSTSVCPGAGRKEVGIIDIWMSRATRSSLSMRLFFSDTSRKRIWFFTALYRM